MAGMTTFCEGTLRLFAISDLHLDFRINREALEELPEFPGDWLITGGDLCTSGDHLREAWDVLCDRFAKVFWVPGNHELWSSRPERNSKIMLSGEEKYQSLVEICQSYGVHTPEDPYVAWPGSGKNCLIAPMFIPYDYSFCPDDVPIDRAVEWAMEEGILCNDEKLINPAPYGDIAHWCEARFTYTLNRLQAHDPETEWVWVNHFPLRRDLVRLKRIPRFIIWCGTRKTENLHREFKVRAVVSGHLHMRATDYRDGVRFEEVALGYPRDWDQDKGMAYYLREILPGPQEVHAGDAGPFWKFF